jgi:hypothetical protein
VVVRDRDVVGIAGVPPEADAPMVVDANAVLASPITHQPFQPIARRHAEVAELYGGIQLSQLPQHNSLQIGGQTPYGLPVEQAGRVSITEAANHRGIVTRRVIIRKR